MPRTPEENNAVNRAEEQLHIQRAQKGDKAAFAALYQTHVQTIYRYVMSRISDSQLAQDITSDVFVKAMSGLASYRDESTPFVAWLYRIAHARVVDVYRQRQRRPLEVDIDDEPIAIESNFDDTLIHHETRQLLQRAMANLTEEQQQVIHLRFVDGHRLEEVAHIMGKNANAIKALQHRALQALLRRFERTGVDIDGLLAGLL